MVRAYCDDIVRRVAKGWREADKEKVVEERGRIEPQRRVARIIVTGFRPTPMELILWGLNWRRRRRRKKMLTPQKQGSSRTKRLREGRGRCFKHDHESELPRLPAEAPQREASNQKGAGRDGEGATYVATPCLELGHWLKHVLLFATTLINDPR